MEMTQATQLLKTVLFCFCLPLLQEHKSTVKITLRD